MKHNPSFLKDDKTYLLYMCKVKHVTIGGFTKAL